jgi:flagellum-specific ATP synthase
VNAFAQYVEQAVTALETSPPRVKGKVTRIVGMTIEARGMRAPIGALCEIKNQTGDKLVAEVVGFHRDTLYLMPVTDIHGIEPGASIQHTGFAERIPVGPELLGRVTDALGHPLDDAPKVECTHTLPARGISIPALKRARIDTILDTGIRAINGCFTVGKGQRIGLIAGSGVGKSMLLGMLTRNTQADVVVIGLIGERGREAQEFVSEILGPEGLSRSIVVIAPANSSPVMRRKAAERVHAIAEYFRDQGQDVLLLCDSLTRVAHAQREIGLAVGEPPTTKGYPPSVFSLLPHLIERAGNGRVGSGSITAFYTVLAEGDDRSDPIVDIARASLDGQLMLSRELADAAHYPAIDPLGSLSRLMHQLVPDGQRHSAAKLRALWAQYQQSKDLIDIGAYQRGSNTELDAAIELMPEIARYLQQDYLDTIDYEDASEALERLLDDIA